MHVVSTVGSMENVSLYFPSKCLFRQVPTNLHPALCLTYVAREQLGVLPPMRKSASNKSYALPPLPPLVEKKHIWIIDYSKKEIENAQRVMEASSPLICGIWHGRRRRLLLLTQQNENIPISPLHLRLPSMCLSRPINCNTPPKPNKDKINPPCIGKKRPAPSSLLRLRVWGPHSKAMAKKAIALKGKQPRRPPPLSSDTRKIHQPHSPLLRLSPYHLPNHNRSNLNNNRNNHNNHNNHHNRTPSPWSPPLKGSLQCFCRLPSASTQHNRHNNPHPNRNPLHSIRQMIICP